MRCMLLINVPAGGGEYKDNGWTPEDWQVHLAYLRGMNQRLTESGELVQVRARTPPIPGVRAVHEARPRNGDANWAALASHLESMLARLAHTGVPSPGT